MPSTELLRAQGCISKTVGGNQVATATALPSSLCCQILSAKRAENVSFCCSCFAEWHFCSRGLADVHRFAKGCHWILVLYKARGNTIALSPSWSSRNIGDVTAKKKDCLDKALVNMKTDSVDSLATINQLRF